MAIPEVTVSNESGSRWRLEIQFCAYEGEKIYCYLLITEAGQTRMRVQAETLSELFTIAKIICEKRGW